LGSLKRAAYTSIGDFGTEFENIRERSVPIWVPPLVNNIIMIQQIPSANIKRLLVLRKDFCFTNRYAVKIKRNKATETRRIVGINIFNFQINFVEIAGNGRVLLLCE